MSLKIVKDVMDRLFSMLTNFNNPWEGSCCQRNINIRDYLIEECWVYGSNGWFFGAEVIQMVICGVWIVCYMAYRMARYVLINDDLMKGVLDYLFAAVYLWLDASMVLLPTVDLKDGKPR